MDEIRVPMKATLRLDASLNRQAVDEALIQVAFDKVAFNKVTDPDEKDAFARAVLARLMLLAREVAGDEILSHYYGPSPNVGDASKDHLMALTKRVMPSVWLLGKQDDDSNSSLKSLILEALSVGNGDAPRLFAKPPNRTNGVLPNSFKLAIGRVRALQWDAFLREKGVESRDREYLIESAFDKDWDTIKGWKKTASQYIDPDFIDAQIAAAKAGSHPPFDFKSADDEWKAALQEHGRAFIKEREASKNG